jgi:hypothetical protein
MVYKPTLHISISDVFEETYSVDVAFSFVGDGFGAVCFVHDVGCRERLFVVSVQIGSLVVGCHHI